jgi:phospholipase/carboxylesterase
MVMPNQQLEQIAPLALQEELWRRMTGLEGVRGDSSGVSLPETRDLHLDRQIAHGPSDAYMVGTEFAHLHGARDGSLHVMLPPQVVAEAIAKGWAEPHPLASRGIAPPTLVMVYGPRDEAELETVWHLIEMSYTFARGPAS